MAKSVKTKEELPEQPVIDVVEENVPQTEALHIDGSNTVDNEIENSPKVVEDLKKEENIMIASTGEEAFLRKLLQLQDEGGWGHHLDDLINERLRQIKK